jgi:hypothetical protein
MLCIAQNISTDIKQTSYDTAVWQTVHDRILQVLHITVAFIFMHIKRVGHIRSGGEFNARQGPVLP